MRFGCGAIAWLVLGCANATAAVGDEPPTGDAFGGVAVAPFEQVGSSGAAIPEVDALLAARLSTRGVARVVGPGELAVAADAEPNAVTVQGWAASAGVTSVVVGRVTRLGDQLSVDVRLRSGATGEVVGTFVAEVAADGAVEPVVEGLADDVAAALGADSAIPVPPPAPKSPGGNAFGIDFDSGRPISIRSDELEAVQNAGARQLVFTKNVVVTQDDVTIRSSRLEAYYPRNASQPDRLVAQGSVRMSQGESEARCDRATFERARDLLVCRGSASLRDADGCVSGEQIEFDLAADTVKVMGGARVTINGRESAGAEGCR